MDLMVAKHLEGLNAGFFLKLLSVEIKLLAVGYPS